MRSGYEYQVRDWLRENHIDFEYEVDVLPYQTLVRGSRCSECGAKVYKQRKYTPDFTIHRDDHSKLYLETKGRFTSTDRSKMRDVKRCHPELDIRFLFQKRSKAETQKVARWCEKFGFDYEFGTEVPSTWLA